jgi:hypothetical protein
MVYHLTRLPNGPSNTCRITPERCETVPSIRLTSLSCSPHDQKNNNERDACAISLFLKKEETITSDCGLLIFPRQDKQAVFLGHRRWGNFKAAGWLTMDQHLDRRSCHFMTMGQCQKTRRRVRRHQRQGRKGSSTETLPETISNILNDRWKFC